MLRRKLLSLVVAAFVLTLAGISFSSNNPVCGPVEMLDYDQTVSIVLGMPKGVPPLSSYKLERHTQYLSADLQKYPPSPCQGITQVWNAVLAAPHMNHEDRREFLKITLGVLAQNACAATIVRDVNANPPTIDSIQPIPTAN